MVLVWEKVLLVDVVWLAVLEVVVLVVPVEVEELETDVVEVTSQKSRHDKPDWTKQARRGPLELNPRSLKSIP